LLAIHHVGRTAGELFYVMDLADDASGHPPSDHSDYQPATLQSRLQNGPLPTELCLDFARQLLAGLASLHAAGMVHRDVKPANCLFVQEKLKLADFGLLTEANPLVSRIGTQKYMPPDGRMDMRADVYAAGLVIYQIITGLPVDDFPRLDNRAAEIAADARLTRLLSLVLQACEREPMQRFADARRMLAALDEPLKMPGRRPKRRTAIAACIALVSATLWAGWISIPQRVTVNFITDPYEAKVLLDDKLLANPDGTPYRTPCTVENLPSGTHRIAFQREGLPRWDAGEYDFTTTRQIVSRRE
jgi:serine/threonine protein kinase